MKNNFLRFYCCLRFSFETLSFDNSRSIAPPLAQTVVVAMGMGNSRSACESQPKRPNFNNDKMKNLSSDKEISLAFHFHSAVKAQSFDDWIIEVLESVTCVF